MICLTVEPPLPIIAPTTEAGTNIRSGVSGAPRFPKPNGLNEWLQKKGHKYYGGVRLRGQGIFFLQQFFLHQNFCFFLHHNFCFFYNNFFYTKIFAFFTPKFFLFLHQFFSTPKFLLFFTTNFFYTKIFAFLHQKILLSKCDKMYTKKNPPNFHDVSLLRSVCLDGPHCNKNYIYLGRARCVLSVSCVSGKNEHLST